MPDLKAYRAKRDPAATPEPFGDEAASGPRVLPAGAPRAFVVQQHAARNLHWDLRLEIDGVLASWAVPKGPTLDPGERRLAVRTEDHPFAYADFEGVIPEGNYGAGAMIVWDRGSYQCVDGASPAAGMESGKLDLVLRGQKLSGRFALIRTRGEGGRHWLLLCKEPAPDDDAPELIESLPASVLSGLRVEQVREGFHAETALEARLADGLPRRSLDPRKLSPMLARSRDEAFSRDGWVFELKYDGVRTRVGRSEDAVVLYSRRGRDVTALYSEIALAARHVPVSDFVLDGEIVALDAQGRPSFERLQGRFTRNDPSAIARGPWDVPVVFYAFDLLRLCGRDLRGLPLVERKALLRELVPDLGLIRYCDHVEREGQALFELACAHGLEGVIAKRADSRYETGRRSDHWLKVKSPRRGHFAIAGFQPGRGSRAELGSLILAWQREGVWVYAGKVGSGLDDRIVAELLPALRESARAAAEISGTPDPLPRGTVFCALRRVCEVSYTEITSAGQLRHPVFRGLRDDLPVSSCVAPGERVEEPEIAVTAPLPEPDLPLSNLDKVFWPDEGYSKGDLLGYYEAAWPWIEPYLRDRPVVLTRYPDGIDGKSFFQKNVPDFTPRWAERETIDDTDYFVCNDVRTLLYVINSGAIPLHVWSARRAAIERPDWCLLDLDPKAAPFEHVVEVARAIHRLLDGLGAPHFVKSSGQAGLHVLVPLGGQLDHDQTRALGEVLARAVVAQCPEIATVTRPVAARGDKVYVDFLQNGRGKLIASALSVRPRQGAPVSMPLRWSQVTRRLDPGRFTIRTAIRELERHGDPLRALFETRVEVAALLDGLRGALGGADPD